MQIVKLLFQQIQYLMDSNTTEISKFSFNTKSKSFEQK